MTGVALLEPDKSPLSEGIVGVSESGDSLIWTSRQFRIFAPSYTLQFLVLMQRGSEAQKDSQYKVLKSNRSGDGGDNALTISTFFKSFSLESPSSILSLVDALSCPRQLRSLMGDCPSEVESEQHPQPFRRK